MKRLKVLMYAIVWSTLIILAFIIGAGCVVDSKLMVSIGIAFLVPWVMMCLIFTWMYSHLKNEKDCGK